MNFSRKNRRISFESMERRELLAADLTLAAPAEGHAEIDFVEVAGEDSGSSESDTWFAADSFKFGVEREMKESGEKGGTEDINIGVGELQECTVSKSMDDASPALAQFAINGNAPGQAVIDFVEVAGGGDDAGSPATPDVTGEERSVTSLYDSGRFSFTPEREMKESGE